MKKKPNNPSLSIVGNASLEYLAPLALSSTFEAKSTRSTQVVKKFELGHYHL